MLIRLLWLCVLLLCTSSGWAQLPLPLANPSLDLRALTVGRVVAPTPDGGALIAHDGRFIGGDLERPGLFKLRPDGSPDPNWSVAPNNTVWSIAIQGDEVYLAGSFSFINNTERRGLARVSLATGELSDWNPNAGSNSSYRFNTVKLIGESVYVGGFFTQIGTTARSHLAKLNRQFGALDASFNPSIGAASPSTGNVPVNVMDTDGSALFIGGNFNSVGGVNRGNAAKLTLSNAVLDPNWTPVFNGGIIDLQHDGGFLYATGCFNDVNGTGRNFLARVSSSGVGALDGTWNPAPNGGCTIGVAVDSNHVYFGGPFTQVGGQAAPRFARVAKTGAGALDSTWLPDAVGFAFGFDAEPLANGSVVLTGEFITVQGQYHPGIVRVNATTAAPLAPAIYSEQRGSIRAIVAAPDGGTYVGGYFQRIGTLQRRGVVRLTPAGVLDTSWNPGFAPDSGANVTALAVDGTHLYVGGDILTTGNGPRRLFRIAHSGTVDTSWAPNPNSSILSLHLDTAAGTLFAGGSFTQISGQNRNRVAEVSQGTGLATSFDPNANGFVRAITSVGNDIYLGGGFTAIGGLPRSRLARVNRSGVVDVNFVADANGEIRALMPGPNNTLYVGGGFSILGGIGRPGFARLRQGNGTPDPAWNTFIASGNIESIVPATDGIYLGGNFQSVGDQARRNVARVSHSGEIAPLFAPSHDQTVFAIAEQGNRVLVGGFHNYFAPITQPRIGVAAYPRDATPVATTLTITSDQPENTQPHQFYRVEVNGVADGTPLANQLIQIECDSGAFCEAFLDSAGNGACELASRTPGTRTLTARWVGSPLFLAATDTEPHTVSGSTATPPANPAFDLRRPGFVNDVVRLSDGSILVGGTFNRIGEVPRRSLAKLSPDGSAAPSWSADVIGSVSALARDANDNVYVSGSFTSIDGGFRPSLAKLTAAGNLDPSWRAAVSFANAIGVDPNGDLIVMGGVFTVSGSPNFYRASLSRLSGSTGALMAGFTAEVTTTSTSIFPSLRIASAGSHIYLYGRFEAINGVPRRNLARLNLDGTLDAGWNPSPNAIVRDLEFDGSSGVYVAGDFAEIAGQTGLSRLVRLAADGTLLPTFAPAPNSSASSLSRDGNSLYVTGFFSQIGGLPRSQLVKLDATSGTADPNFAQIPTTTPNVVSVGFVERLGTELWVSSSSIQVGASEITSMGAARFNAGTAAQLSTATLTQPAFVAALARQPDGATLIGGFFGRLGSTQRNLVRISANGQFDTAFNPPINNTINSLLVRGNGDIYVAEFGLRKLNTAGVLDSSFISPNSSVFALADGGDGLIAGGSFTSVGVPAAPRNRIAKLDYATGAAVANWNPDANNAVYSLAVNAAGEVYFGGDFTTVGGAARQRLAKLNVDGSLNAAWQPAANSRVQTLLVGGADIYAGGFFSTLAGQTRRGLGKLSAADGALTPWDPVGTSSSTIYALAKAQDGAILAGGSFRFMGGAYRSNAAKLDPVSGVADPLWNPSTDSTVRALLVGYGNTPTAVRLPAIEENIAIGGQFEFMGAASMPGFVAVPTIPVPTEERVFCSGFEANACVPLP